MTPTRSKIAIACTLLLLARTSFGDEAAPAEMPFRVRAGFHVECVYQVPRETQGSWVALAVDPRGRLIASDQTGSLYRLDPQLGQPVTAERIELPIGRAHGLLFAFDSLYAVVGEKGEQGPGLYRIRDTDNNDVFDQVELLQSFAGSGEHGPHGLVLSPNGRSLFVVAGNKTPVPEAALEASLVPTHWGEDDLLPRLWGPVGSEAGTPAPGGWIASTDPEGKQWQLHAVGLRNAFDLAFHPSGDLFAVDADAEFDLGTPWYQPTRVFHVVAGTDFGWRSGAGKWPTYYADTLPPVVELGTGSPTGITFARGTSLPPRYQNSLLVGDWSRGRIVAVDLQPRGSSYQGSVEEIVSGTPLPVTDLVVHPQERCIYFTVGGRGTTSGLYRLSWQGNELEPIVSSQNQDQISDEERSLRTALHHLTSLIRSADQQRAINEAWPYLSQSDRTLRHAARIVLEHVPHEMWQERAFSESNSLARMTTLLALARANDSRLLPRMIQSLTNVDWDRLATEEQSLLLRCLDVAFLRLASNPLDKAPPDAAIRTQALEYLQNRFPTGDQTLDFELCRLLVFLDAPHVAKLAMQQIAQAVTPQERLSYAVQLRLLRNGWTDELRRQYFSVLRQATSWRGGLSLAKYLELIAADALAHVPADKREQFAELLKQPADPAPVATKQRPFVREWTLAELVTFGTLAHDDADPSAGRKLLAEAQCFPCHRFRGEGGAVGPDLTTVASRLSTRDLLEAIVDPNRVISDQFAATTILTTDGRVLTGRVINLQQTALLVQTDMLDPARLERIETEDIEQMQPASTSMMPGGLLNTFSRDEIIELVSFMKSSAPPQDRVAGNLIMLNDNAGWCWYQDEKIIYDPASGKVLTSSIANAAGYNGKPREADIDVTTFAPATGRRLRVTMGKRNSYNSGDDHNVGALWVRPDGRYLHVWTGHNEPSRNCFFRISTRPHDVSQWSPEQTFNWPEIGNPDMGQGHTATYNNLYYLADERDGRGRLFDITRESQRSPNIAYSDDLGETWHYAGKLTLTRTKSSYSNGYLKYCGNGKNRIDFITTEHHPRDYNTSIYHGYIQGGKSYNSLGKLIDDNIFDEQAPAPEDFTCVFATDEEDGINDDREFHRAWTIELERDEQGNLVALFSTRYGTAMIHDTPGEADHRLFYARFDGEGWQHTEIAKMGGPLWKSEEDYVGLGTIHPDNPNLIYISTNHDPRNESESPKREIYKGETVDLGRSWTWTAITERSTADNLRPAIPRWDASHTAVCWLRGHYGSQHTFDQTLVGIIEDPTVSIGKVDYIDANGENTTPASKPWELESTFGNGNDVYMARSAEQQSQPSLLTTKVAGLADGTYDVWAYFWSPDDEDWRLRGGFEPSDLLVFRRRASQHAEPGHFAEDVRVSAPGMGLYRAYIGRTIVNGRADIQVTIGEFQGQATVAYDGVGVARVKTGN